MKNAKLTSIPVNVIQLDKENPRIKHCLENYTNVTPEAIALALWDSGDGDAQTSYRALRDSIKESGGIIHPIIVNCVSSGDYIVIEGNTRVQIYKDFLSKGVEGDWENIPALVYKNLSEEDKHSIRLQSHLVGPRAWDPYSKAKYLYQLSELEALPMNSIINKCGGNTKSNDIIKSIAAYRYMQLYYAPYINEKNLTFDVRDYSKFREYENSRVKESIKHRGFADNQFAKWVVDENVDKAQGVRLIPAIMRNEDALNAFLKDNLSAAEKVLHAEQLSKANLSEYPYELLATELYKKLLLLSATEVVELARNPCFASKRDALELLKSKLDFIISEIESKDL